jgi:hypothetical protein
MPRSPWRGAPRTHRHKRVGNRSRQYRLHRRQLPSCHQRRRLGRAGRQGGVAGAELGAALRQLPFHQFQVAGAVAKQQLDRTPAVTRDGQGRCGAPDRLAPRSGRCGSRQNRAAQGACRAMDTEASSAAGPPPENGWHRSEVRGSRQRPWSDASGKEALDSPPGQAAA